MHSYNHAITHKITLEINSLPQNSGFETTILTRPKIGLLQFSPFRNFHPRKSFQESGLVSHINFSFSQSLLKNFHSSVPLILISLFSHIRIMSDSSLRRFYQTLTSIREFMHSKVWSIPSCYIYTLTWNFLNSKSETS